MLLAEYDYYCNEYGSSSIPDELPFKKAIRDASSKINLYTLNRINKNNINNLIRNTACEIAELIYSNEELKSKLINNDDTVKASETVGSHSVSYVNKTATTDKYIYSNEELEKECYRICLKNLGMTGLMYRGI